MAARFRSPQPADAAAGKSAADASLPDAAAEPIIEAFEIAWQRGEPAIEEFLKRWHGPSAAILGELALVDLEYRIKRDLGPALDRYTVPYPELAADAVFQSAAARMLADAARSAAVAALAGASFAPDDECRFDDFAIEAVIGRGGMAVVHRGRRRATGEIVAIKVLPAVGPRRDETTVRFLREVRTARRLDHPNIVAVEGAGKTPAGEPFIVMEFVAGGTLDDHLSRGGLSIADVARIVASVADAVEHAHGQGIIHRDLKPANVLLTEEGDVRVSDFGLAKTLGGVDMTITVGSVGTAGFMAPEQADRGLGMIGPHTDVYGLGGILYACFTGRPPYAGGSLFEVLEAVCRHEPPPSPRTLRPDLPRAIEDVCLACLEKKPSRRLGSAALVAAALRSWAREPGCR